MDAKTLSAHLGPGDVEAQEAQRHGGRQVEGLPAAIDVLPAIANAVGKRATVLMDSGVRSGLDVARSHVYKLIRAFGLERK